eukprot:10988030-Alexandrium_andersonii.AAC.1
MLLGACRRVQACFGAFGLPPKATQTYTGITDALRLHTACAKVPVDLIPPPPSGATRARL